jgi:hypothetical protein
VEGMGQPVAAGQQQRQGMRRRRQFGSRCWAAVVNRLELGQAAEVVSGGHSLPDQEGDWCAGCQGVQLRSVVVQHLHTIYRVYAAFW